MSIDLAINDNDQKLACIKGALELVPIGNRVTLDRLFGFLKKVSQNSDKNLMTVQ